MRYVRDNGGCGRDHDNRRRAVQVEILHGDSSYVVSRKYHEPHFVDSHLDSMPVERAALEGQGGHRRGGSQKHGLTDVLDSG